MTQIKGTALRGTLKFVKGSNLAGGIPRVIDELPGPARVVFDQPILSGSWYPYEAFTELLKVLDRDYGRGDPAFLEALGRFAAREDVTGVFKIISVLASIPRIMQSASHFWGRYCDAGRFEIPEIEDGRGIGRIVDFPDISREHTHLLVGWIGGIGLAAGAKAVDVRLTKSIPAGDDRCEFDMRWSKD